MIPKGVLCSPRAKPRSGPFCVARGRPPRPPLGVIGPSPQVTAPAAACGVPPLRSADHPATPWWSALLRGGKAAGAGAGGGEEQKSGGRDGSDA